MEENMTFGSDEQEEKALETNEDKEKKMKNLISLTILLVGLLIGSLFVDFAQLVKGSGYSQKNLNKSEIFEASGKTWVAYSEPAVPVTVISDDTCPKCDPSDVLVFMRRVLPTVSTTKVNFDSAAGKDLLDKYGIKTLPAFIFDPAVTGTDFYTQAQPLFSQKDDKYVLKTDQLGVPVGKYLSLPTINDSDATVGQKDAKVKVVVFSDFQCPYCKVFWKGLRDTMKSDADNVIYDYKHLPLDIHPQAANAALASACAQDQGKFWEYGDKLYATQAEWSAAKDTAKFKDYARQLGLDTAKFNTCLDQKKFQDAINADKDEAANFGISGTPAVFVNDQFTAGAMTAADLKTAIDEQLAK